MNTCCLTVVIKRICCVMGAGVVIGLERGADLHMAQLMPLPLTVSCFSKIHIGFTFLVLPLLSSRHPGSPGQRAVKWLCVCLIVLLTFLAILCLCIVYGIQRLRFVGCLINR